MKLLLAAAITLASPLLAVGDNKAEAQKHLEVAAAAYKEKRWQDVLDALNKAYALDPRPEVHFSLGQVYVKMGRCPDAIVAYEQFIASKPGGDAVGMAKEAIDACKAAAVVTPDPPPVEPQPELPPTPPPVDPTPPPVQPPVKDTTGLWYQDKVGVALVGGGAAATLVGITFYALAKGALSDAEDAATYGKQQNLYDSAKTRRAVSVVFTVGGLAAIGAGVYYYMKIRKPAEQRGVGLVPIRDGGLITWASPF